MSENKLLKKHSKACVLIVEWVHFACINEKLSCPSSFWGESCSAPRQSHSRHCTGQWGALPITVHCAVSLNNVCGNEKTTHSVSSNESCQVLLGEILCIYGLNICFLVASEQNLKLIAPIKPKTCLKTKVNIPSWQWKARRVSAHSNPFVSKKLFKEYKFTNCNIDQVICKGLSSVQQRQPRTCSRSDTREQRW